MNDTSIPRRPTVLAFRTDDDVQVDLVAADIPFSATGLSRAVVVDEADGATLRLMLSEALSLAARLTTRCRQYELVVAQLREALRTRRAA